MTGPSQGTTSRLIAHRALRLLIAAAGELEDACAGVRRLRDQERVTLHGARAQLRDAVPIADLGQPIQLEPIELIEARNRTPTASVPPAIRRHRFSLEAGRAGCQGSVSAGEAVLVGGGGVGAASLAAEAAGAIRARRPGRQAVRDRRDATVHPIELSAYAVRMARVNITIPDDVLASARALGLNVSRIATTALLDEVDRNAKAGALASYVARLEEELGPVSDADAAAARRWADEVLGAGDRKSRARRV